MAAQGGDELRYVIQRINTGVFKDPRAVMENIFGVTEYLRRKDTGARRRRGPRDAELYQDENRRQLF